MTKDVLRGGKEQRWLVAEAPKTVIATMAEQRSDGAGSVVVIDVEHVGQFVSMRPATDRTNAILGRKHAVVIIKRKAEFVFEIAAPRFGLNAFVVPCAVLFVSRTELPLLLSICTSLSSVFLWMRFAPTLRRFALQLRVFFVSLSQVRTALVAFSSEVVAMVVRILVGHGNYRITSTASERG